MPILIRLVRAATALATVIGAEITERSGAPCNSASQIASRPHSSAASTSAIAWSKAAASPTPATGGNSWKMPNSIAPFSATAGFGIITMPARGGKVRGGEDCLPFHLRFIVSRVSTRVGRREDPDDHEAHRCRGGACRRRNRPAARVGIGAALSLLSVLQPDLLAFPDCRDGGRCRDRDRYGAGPGADPGALLAALSLLQQPAQFGLLRLSAGAAQRSRRTAVYRLRLLRAAALSLPAMPSTLLPAYRPPAYRCRVSSRVVPLRGSSMLLKRVAAVVLLTTAVIALPVTQAAAHRHHGWFPLFLPLPRLRRSSAPRRRWRPPRSPRSPPRPTTRPRRITARPTPHPATAMRPRRLRPPITATQAITARAEPSRRVARPEDVSDLGCLLRLNRAARRFLTLAFRPAAPATVLPRPGIAGIRWRKMPSETEVESAGQRFAAFRIVV